MRKNTKISKLNLQNKLDKYIKQRYKRYNSEFLMKIFLFLVERLIIMCYNSIQDNRNILLERSETIYEYLA